MNVRGSISQTRFVQGETGQAFLTVSIDPPPSPEHSVRSPVDMVIVLDRSGSMADARKFPYAKEAIIQLVRQLSESDRFALISFDHEVRIESPLTPITESARERIITQVQGLVTGGSTNIGAGIETAKQLLRDNPSSRSRRVLLLSDGEANVGIVQPKDLQDTAKLITAQDAVLSTIGLGLGFNESLLSAMADLGMGAYSYMEDLNSLGQIFAQNLSEARVIYAAKTFLEIILGQGISLQNASGYPVEREGPIARIPTGQLLYGAKKTLTLALMIPTSSTGRVEIPDIRFVYDKGGEQSSITLPRTLLAYEIVPLEKRGEALASVNEAVYKDAWTKNSYGALQLEVQQALRSGDSTKAKEAIVEYRQKLSKAEGAGGVRGLVSAATPQLQKLDSEIDLAANAPASERDDKMNRLAKKQHEESLQNQRK